MPINRAMMGTLRFAHPTVLLLAVVGAAGGRDRYPGRREGPIAAMGRSYSVTLSLL